MSTRVKNPDPEEGEGAGGDQDPVHPADGARRDDDGYFWDVSAGKKYYGRDIGKTVEVYAKAFPDMHRELYDFYVKDDENKVIVELSLNGTQDTMHGWLQSRFSTSIHSRVSRSTERPVYR